MWMWPNGHSSNINILIYLADQWHRCPRVVSLKLHTPLIPILDMPGVQSTVLADVGD